MEVDVTISLEVGCLRRFTQMASMVSESSVGESTLQSPSYYPAITHFDYSRFTQFSKQLAVTIEQQIFVTFFQKPSGIGEMCTKQSLISLKRYTYNSAAQYRVFLVTTDTFLGGLGRFTHQHNSSNSMHSVFLGSSLSQTIETSKMSNIQEPSEMLLMTCWSS